MELLDLAREFYSEYSVDGIMNINFQKYVENELIMKYVNDVLCDVSEIIHTKMNNTDIVSLSSENEEMRNEKIRESIVLLLSLDMKLPPGLESFCVMKFLRK